MFLFSSYCGVPQAAPLVWNDVGANFSFPQRISFHPRSNLPFDYTVACPTERTAREVGDPPEIRQTPTRKSIILCQNGNQKSCGTYFCPVLYTACRDPRGACDLPLPAARLNPEHTWYRTICILWICDKDFY